jgi:hypothetical protein
MRMTESQPPPAHVEFCGEIFPVREGAPLLVGREGGLEISDNQYLHRRFLEISVVNGLVWMSNVGTHLPATVADGGGLVQAWLSPGARIPIVFEETIVWFSAGPTTYEFTLRTTVAPFQPTVQEFPEAGTTTIGRLTFTPDQRRLMVALAEPVLRRVGQGPSSIPSTAEAAERLGWTITKFTRKLDNVCDKLARTGVRGLQGNSNKLASGRRARLVEYAVATHLVTTDDLDLLLKADG